MTTLALITLASFTGSSPPNSYYDPSPAASVATATNAAVSCTACVSGRFSESAAWLGGTDPPPFSSSPLSTEKKGGRAHVHFAPASELCQVKVETEWIDELHLYRSDKTWIFAAVDRFREEDAAARVIQAAWRGYVVRQMGCLTARNQLLAVDVAVPFPSLGGNPSGQLEEPSTKGNNKNRNKKHQHHRKQRISRHNRKGNKQQGKMGRDRGVVY